MRMRSPSRTRPIAPPAAASGEACPIDNPEVPGQISSLFPSLLPAIYLSESKDPTTVTRTNAIVQTSTLINASPVIEGAIKAGKLKVVPAVYDVGTSKVELLEIPASIRLAGR